MSTPTVTRLALLGWALSLAFAASTVVFYALSPSVEPTREFGRRGTEVTLALAFVAFTTVGALVLSRSPARRIGGLLLAAGLSFQVFTAAFGYAAYALVERPGALPGGELAAWLSRWTYVPGLTLLFVLFLVFPTGEALSRRWLVVVVATVAVGTADSFGWALSPGPVDALQAVEVEGPFSVEGAAKVLSVADPLLLPVTVLTAVAVVLRYRRSRGEERLQLKWFVTAAVLGVATTIGSWMTTSASPTVYSLFGFANILALGSIPVAIGIAIFRYRLYEIDLIIRGTVVYGAVSALLLGLYIGGVIALQEVFSSFAGGSDLAIAVSTLFVAALFRPVRGRIQVAVDQRFYRRRYDARKTLETFGNRLREALDVDGLEAELRTVLTETLQPAHASVWIRSGRRTTTTRRPARHVGHGRSPKR